MEQHVKVLVIEDEQNIRENIQEMLEAKGYIVRASKDGKQGVVDAIDFKPHLIVCDIMMPEMDGHMVLEYIRKTSIVQNTPFIFLTACADKIDIRAGMNMGADDYLTKPFIFEELLEAIEARLKRHQKVIDQYSRVKHELDTTVFATYYHEFNTPLHGILGGLNLLLNGRNSFSEDEMQELLTSILKSGLRLNHSVSNLMLFEELKRAEVYPELLSVFSNGLAQITWVRKVEIELLAVANDIYSREDDVIVDLQPCEIKINKDYIERIVLELADNSLKFSKPGQKVYVSGKSMGDGYKVEVTDTGRGFELGSLNNIAPFKQFKRKKFEQQGLGIGLYLVKRLVELNCGQLEIISTEEGTNIQVYLPLAEDTETPEAVSVKRQIVA
jgi:DNA-binding response OmpR family regulator/anti-sigma regulatory factor (Ser/Thr protein kinase)